MNRIFVLICALFVWGGSAPAQIIPGRYIVELDAAPAGIAAQSVNDAAVGAQLAQILGQQSRVRAQIQAVNGQVVGSTARLLDTLFVRIPDDQAGALSSIPGVKKVYPVRELHMTLDHALPLHQVPAAWDTIGGVDRAGAGMKIAIIDTGISPDHPAFQDSSLKTPPGYPKASSAANLALTTNKIIVARSYEDIYQLTDPDSARDLNGHGTETAMVAAGETNKGPLATITGVAPKAWIGGYKIVALNEGIADEGVILKAFDDALADGMDVINLSFGSNFPPDDLTVRAIDRLTKFGIVFVTSAGNSGPGLDTIGDAAAAPAAISVGAISNDRYFASAVIITGGGTDVARRGTGPQPTSPVSGTVFDVSRVDPSGLLCSALPAGSATGKIALIFRGTCTFEAKANNAQAGGAVAAIIYTTPASPVAIIPSTGAATLPVVMIGNADGVALKALVTRDPSTIVTINFQDVAFSQDPNRLATFTSKGPVIDADTGFAIMKPDLTAVGTDMYMATQSADPTGDLYSKDGYISADGTSFSSPLVAGAAAVLRGFRPGLTVDQYRSLLINSAKPLIGSDGFVGRVQQTGPGILNLDGALKSSVTVYPTSLSFDVGSGILGGADTGDFKQLTITNVSKVKQKFSVWDIVYDSAPAPQFSVIPFDENPTSTLSLTLDPGQSQTVYAYWTTINRLSGGEYQGQVVVQPDTGGFALVPYWYGVPTFVVRTVFQLNADTLPTSARRGTTVALYVRVTDDIGYPLFDRALLAFASAVVAGGGAISLAPFEDPTGYLEIDFKLGPAAGTNVFQFAFGRLAPVTITINGR